MMKISKVFWGAIAVALLIIGYMTFFSSSKISPSLALSQSNGATTSIDTVSQSGLYPIGNAFIDKTGKVALKLPKNAFLPFNFVEGLAAVNYADPKSQDRNRNRFVGYIDKTGKFVIPPGKFIYTEGLDGAENFSEGFAVVVPKTKHEDDPELYGYIDKSGKIVIPAKFEDARPFSSGMAVVGVSVTSGKEQYKRFTIIDRQGKFILDNPKAYADERLLATEGLAAISVAEKWGFVDITGKFVIQPQFSQVGMFADGLAPALETYEMSSLRCGKPGYDGMSKYGYIDRTGKFIIPPQFADAKPFSEGLAAVKISDPQSGKSKWGYIDRTGKFIIPDQFEDAGRGAWGFSDGLAEVPVPPKKSGRNYSSGYIDRTGKFVIQPQFNSHGGSFIDGLAYVGIMYEPNPNLEIPEISAEQSLKEANELQEIFKAHPNGFKDSELSPKERAIFFDRMQKQSISNISPYKGGVEGYIDRTGKFIWKKEYAD
jgi:WG containing repeat